LVSIEFAHIYADEVPSAEHFESAGFAADLKRSLEQENWRVRLDVLIDDYNTRDTTLDLPGFVHLLDSWGAPPDVVGSEASLVPAAEDLLANSSRASRSARQYLASHGRMPCSALLTSWHLLRLLGGRPPSGFFLHGQPSAWNTDGADLLINILHPRSAEVEMKALPLMSTRVGPSLQDRITEVYLEAESQPGTHRPRSLA
jgi:hypothetical protein